MVKSLRTAPVQGLSPDKRYYHGAGSEAAAADILRNGIKPPEVTGPTGGLVPIRGHVYLSSELSFANVYAGKSEKDQYGKLKGDPQYRYIFVVYPSDLRDVYPDEDEIGEMVSKQKPKWLHDFAEEVLQDQYGTRMKQCVLPDEIGSVTRDRMASEGVDLDADDEIADWLEMNEEYDREEFWEWSTDNLYDAAMFGEYTAWAEAGKILLPMLDDDQVLDLIGYGKNIAHRGVVRPSECWKISWGAGVKLETYADLQRYADRCDGDVALSMRKLKSKLLR